MIELMVVMGIMAIVMTMAIPSIYRRLHPDSMQKIVSDLMEACSHARARAILDSRAMDLVIRAADGEISVQPGAGSGQFQASEGGESFATPTGFGLSAGKKSAGAAFSARMSEKIAIEAAEINFFDIMEMEEARVRFYPNGTCDEFKMVLLRPESGERRLITLEVTTGLVDVESDVSKFLR